MDALGDLEIERRDGLACGYSLAIRSAAGKRSLSDQNRAAQRRFGALAFETLNQAIRLGYKYWAQLQRDPNLAALRTQPHYDRLMTALRRR